MLGLKHSVAHIDAKSINRFQTRLTLFILFRSKIHVGPNQIPVRLSLKLN